MPPYTAWGRSRSGCFFCFYQQKIEWVRSEGAATPISSRQRKPTKSPFEGSGNTFTWSERESLSELEQPERVSRQSRTSTPGAKLPRRLAALT